MPAVDMTDEQIIALIINYLVRRRCWGGRYFNKQKLIRYLGQDVLGDGKKVSRCMDIMIKKRWLNNMKKGETISLNIHYKREIMEHKREFESDEFLI